MYFETPSAGKLFYSSHGTGSPVVLLHPVGLDSRVWDGVAAVLSRTYRVICLDFRGHGQSGHPEAAFTVEDLATDVVALAGHLGLESFVLGGLSLGGMVAQVLAVAHSERLSGLVLADATAWGDPAVMNARAARVESGGMGAAVDDTLDRWFTPETFRTRPDLVRETRATLLQDDPQVHAWTWRAIGRYDVREGLASLHIPCLILCGELDRATPPAQSLDLNRRIAGSVCVVIPGAAHMAPLEAPDRVAAEMLEFLAAQ